MPCGVGFNSSREPSRSNLNICFMRLSIKAGDGMNGMIKIVGVSSLLIIMQSWMVSQQFYQSQRFDNYRQQAPKKLNVPQKPAFLGHRSSKKLVNQSLKTKPKAADRKYKAAFFDSAPLSNPKPAFKIPKNWPYWKQGYMKTRLACG